MHANYARVSTEEQAKSGYSLANQLRANRQKLISLGVNSQDIIDYIDDGYSGEFLERPALDKLRKDIRNKVITGYISIFDPDRLSRNLTNTLLLADEFEKYTTQLIFVTAEYDSSPEGKMFFSIRGAVAAFEKAKIRERSMGGKLEKALSGKLVIPKKKYGYDIADDMYKINAVETKIVKDIYSMCIDKKMSLHKIAQYLNDNKLLNKHGRPFKFKYIYSILLDSAYSGTLYEMKSTWRKTGRNKYDITSKDKADWIPISIPAIVSLEDQIKAKIQLSDNAAFSNRNKRMDYLLTGMIKCGICGKGMIAISYNRKPTLLKYYICYGKRDLKICPESAYVSVDEIESCVWQDIVKFAKTTGYLPYSNNVSNKQQEINELILKHNILKKDKDDITSLVLEKLIDNTKARKKLRQLVNGINSIETQISELKSSQESFNKKVKIELSDIIKADTTKKKHELLRNYGINVVVYKKKGQDLKYEILV
jgi:DNA invertase Pin-like site-specific DNA recombinase